MLIKNFDYQIIANLLAGRGQGEKKLSQVKNYLQKNNFSFQSLEIRKPTPISQVPPDGRIKITKGVICLGGDGTVSETIGFMKKRNLDLPIIIVPTGTANFLASSVGIKLGRNLESAFKGKTKKFDLGVFVSGGVKDYFLIGIGFGFEQKFLELAKQYRIKYLGKLNYFILAFLELFHLKPIGYTLEIDDQLRSVTTSTLLILNLKPRITSFFPLFPERQISYHDGQLDIFYVEHRNPIVSFLGIIFFHLLGRINFGLVTRLKTKKLIINSTQTANSQVDGEIKGKLPLEVSIIPSGVQFLV